MKRIHAGLYQGEFLRTTYQIRKGKHSWECCYATEWCGGFITKRAANNHARYMIASGESRMIIMHRVERHRAKIWEMRPNNVEVANQLLLRLGRLVDNAITSGDWSKVSTYLKEMEG